ncbi:MAG: AAA family ATPase [Pseudomonadota bacterium]
MGPYVVEKRIGFGGMGVVFQAHHRTTLSPVAIKRVRLRSPQLLAAFQREIHALAKLRHPNVIRILDHGTDGDFPWYAMDLVPGQPLSRLLSSQRLLSEQGPPSGIRRTLEGEASPSPPTINGGIEDVGVTRLRVAGLPPKDCVRIGRAICRALSCIHGQGLVHRDLKPDNVLIQPDGTAVLVDFGLVVQFGGREVLELAESAGTLVYMAPEQRLGRFVDARADLYSLGCLLYECLCGVLPYGPLGMLDGTSSMPLPPSVHNPELGTGFDALLRNLLAREPKARLGYADDVEAALAQIDGIEDASARQLSVYLYRSELAGQDALLQRLDARLTAARADEPCVVLVTGESGGGKTRLLKELTTRAVDRGMQVVTGECPPVGTDAEGAGVRVAPLRPFRELLLMIAEHCRRHGPGQTRYLLGQGRAHVLLAYEPSIADLALSGEPAAVPPISPDAARQRLFTCLGGLIVDYARVQPLLLALDDLQWADDLSLEFLSWLAEASEVASGSYAVVATCRAEETNDMLRTLGSKARAVNANLEKFDRLAIRQMVGDMLALAEPPAPLVDFVQEESGGNPFFISEYLRAAIDAGLLRRDAAGRWRLAFAGESAEFRERVMPPPTIAAMVAQRLKDLDFAASDVLRAAAVLGRDFEVDLVASVAARDTASVLSAYATIHARRILEEGESGVSRFAHDQLRESVYAAIPADVRGELHARAAAALEERYSSREGRPFLGELGYHHARAGSAENASRYYEEAGRAAQQAYANRDAARFYQLALEQIGRLPATAGLSAHQQGLCEQAGDALLTSGRPAEARALFSSALEGSSGNTLAESARRRRKLAQTFEREHHHVEALQAYARAEAELGAFPEQAESASEWWHEYVQIRVDKGWALYFLARVDELTELVRDARPAVLEHGTPAQKTRFLVTVVQVALKRDRFHIHDETLEVARSVLREAAETQDPRELANARFTCAFVLLMRGLDEEAEPLFLDAIHSATQVDDATLRMRSQAYHLVSERRLGRVDETERDAQQLLLETERRNVLDYVGVAHANLAWVALQRQMHELVEQRALAAIAAWNQLKPYVYPFQWLARFPLFTSFYDRGRVEDALEQLSLSLVDPQKQLPEELRHATERALALRDVESFRDVTHAAINHRFL